MSDKDRHKRYERAKLRVLFQVPFFASGVAKLSCRFTDETETPGLTTAATNGTEIIWSREFFDKMDDRCVVTVACHEVCHCMLGHLWRAPTACDWEQWNQATDHAVNLMLKEFSEQVMAQRLADPFPFPDPQDAYCADPAYKGLAEEVIYSRLSKQPKSKGGGKGSMPGFGQILKPANPDPNAPQSPSGQSGAVQGQPGGQSPAQGQANGQIDPKALASEWKNTLDQSLLAHKGRGTVPGGFIDKAERMLRPQVPWFELVRNWLREQAADDWSWQKPNRFYDESGFILPSLDSERVGVMVFGKDTSGSINLEVASHFVTEQQTCLDDLKPKKLVDIQCDTKIQAVYEYTPGDSIKSEFKGRGGTSFIPVFEHIEEMAEVPKCLVYLTDLDGTFPDKEPPFPVLWVTWDKTGTAPWGDIIRVNDQA